MALASNDILLPPPLAVATDPIVSRLYDMRNANQISTKELAQRITSYVAGEPVDFSPTENGEARTMGSLPLAPARTNLIS